MGNVNSNHAKWYDKTKRKLLVLTFEESLLLSII